ncbi:MAG TPA: multicopper oxidase domain-containing protein, partial [Micavibrio sp.]
MDKRWIIALSLLFSGAAAQAAAGVSAHKIDIIEKPVKINGMTTMARLFNGQLPGPLIRAREGEQLNATFCNKMTVPTSVHWHGARLPNSQDGVPGITTPEIQPGACLTYKFPVVQSGTYWYHAHSNNQEQQGLYGPLIFDPAKSDPLKADHEIQVMLSDFTHEDPKWVLLNLKREDDYYALCKGTVQSWDKVIANGKQAVKNRLNNAWNRMGPMDMTDVCYSGRGDAFLINGNPAATRLDDPKKPVLQHESARLRLVNAGASSTFDIRSGCGGPMTIIAKDGMPVEEKDVTSFRMAPAETYDVRIDKHEKESCGIRGTSIDGTGEVIGIIGGGSDPILPPRPEKPNPYAQAHDHQGSGNEKMEDGDKNPHAAHDMMNHDMAGHEGMNHEGMGHEGMDHHGSMMAEAGPLDMSYTGLRALEPAVLNPNKPWKEIEMHLTGQMQGYVWSFDDKISSESKPID